MRTVAVFLFFACLAICHCRTPHGQANAGGSSLEWIHQPWESNTSFCGGRATREPGKRRDISLSRKNTDIDAHGHVHNERRTERCKGLICKSQGPQYPHRQRRHMKASRSKSPNDRRCHQVCKKIRLKHRDPFVISMPLS